MSELKAFESERIYWAVEQVEREAVDIDNLHLDDNLFYIKSEADKVIAEKDKEIALLKERICNGDVSRLTWIDDCIAKDKTIADLKNENLNLKAKNIELQSFYDLHGNVDNYIDELKAENSELKQKLQDQCISCPVKMQEDDVVAELKQKLEDVQASMYCYVVDANMENRRLKEMMPEYEQFIKDKKFEKEIVDKYDGYVYEWMGHRYIATPYINLFIKGILRALWIARAKRAIAEAEYWYGHTSGMYYIDAKDVPDEEDDPYKRVKDTTIGWYKTWMNIERKCRAKAEEYK